MFEKAATINFLPEIDWMFFTSSRILNARGPVLKIFILLFRGINVGGRNILPMKALIRVLQELGMQNVKTYIQSGNVVFKSEKKRDDLVQRIKVA